MRMVSAVPEHGEDGRPTGRVEIRAVRDHEGASSTVVIARLEVDAAVDLIGDLGVAIQDIRRDRSRRQPPVDAAGPLRGASGRRKLGKRQRMS